MTSLAARLDRALAALPRAYPGLGGAIAVLQDSEVLAWFGSGLHAKRGIPWLARLWPLSV